MSKILSFLTWQRVPAREIAFRNLRQESKFLLAYAIFYVILAFGIGFLILKFPLPLLGAKDFVQDFWYSAVFKFGFLLLLPAFLFFRIWNYSMRDLLLGIRPKPSVLIKGGLLIALGFSLNLRYISKITEQLPVIEDAGLRLFVGTFLPLLIAGLPEELFFRGMLQTRLEKIWNAQLAVVISGLLFTAWHLPSRFFLANGVEGQAGDLGSVLLGTGLPVFLVSCFFGWHWARYRNLPLLILVHWAIDILPSLSSFFGVSN
ncbi:CPBP family intramembrane glutamic endopeptidase [Algoriphagus sp. A40]|uniref:CPBP family intramembrane glutamic endopeptidase n=1 Tax=Algoriphagus sp. A40 TaxID=1945863 RepID=UPI000985E146|nr:type II CAAX endopeptidase family protein [Algoriphagus sp. A40]OOG76760.1 hypothetical protein B0E43_07160 [Algoriphagus sp. A40]